MALDTYANIQLAVADRMHRTDLATVVPDLIRQAEDIIFADLTSANQDMSVILSTVASTETLALPTDFIMPRSLAFSSTSQNGTLEYLTPAQYSEDFQSNNTGVPRVYTVINTTLYLQPIPDAIYTIRMFYSARLAALSNTNTTNWLLTKSPSVYLYAALVQAAIYCKKDPTTFQAAYEKAIEGINLKSWAQGHVMAVKQDINLATNIYS